ncbi:MAG: sodium:proton antiporter NhaD [Flavobacteriales bacterium]|jgi:Na+/H+ antiporter NhaD/arsenite permease-like protein|nr:sodium:proton antiporter NhaD [Flavobacteriales bacterium]
MEILILVIFVVGYFGIALEHPLHVDKSAFALLTGTLCWAVFVIGGKHDIPEHSQEEYTAITTPAESIVGNNAEAAEMVNALKEPTGWQDGVEYHETSFYEFRLLHHLQEIASILFFLLGAMTIVELIDAHEGFSVITDRIKTTNTVKLLWIVGLLTFFLSAALDNLTTTIVMISLLRKLISDKMTRWYFAGIVVIAANAGGAWSPIGDVTTTMLWIGNQLSTGVIISHLFIPSLVCLIAPLLVASFMMKGNVERPRKAEGAEHYLNPTTDFERNSVFIIGILGLLFVPVFKTVTHLPPFMGMMMSLGIIWLVTEVMHRNKNTEDKNQLSVIAVLRKIDASSVLFFLGILLAVAALQEVGHLLVMAEWLKTTLANVFAIDLAIGVLSAIVDNVPLVAASMGMYPIIPDAMASGAWDMNFVHDGLFWQFLAYCAGTGGSALIIGSAAGVAAMGLEKIDFIWYAKKISILALVGYFAGAAVFYVMFFL